MKKEKKKLNKAVHLLIMPESAKREKCSTGGKVQGSKPILKGF